MFKSKGLNLLKVAIFCTGVSGIVAEYTLSTLASYFLGNSIVQWTLMVSLMLFSMGVGSLCSKFIKTKLLQNFILLELGLSLIVSFSAMIVYTMGKYPMYTGMVVYGLGFLNGFLIGMEIPLVTRINEEYEKLRDNISSIMALDYIGSLVGGVFFVWVGLKILTLTYTPFVLGGVNLLVALMLMLQMKKAVSFQLWLKILSFVTLLSWGIGLVFAKPVEKFAEQARYREKVIYSEQTDYQKIVITQWHSDFWLFLNGNEQLSSKDEWMYHEPIVHVPMKLSGSRKRVLVLGGGDGCAVREILKYKEVEDVVLVDLDPAMTKLGKTHEVLTSLNKGAFEDEKVKVYNTDALRFLVADSSIYDVILVDLPDPKSVDISKLYSQEFYRLCKNHLSHTGVMITQAGSPMFAEEAFYCIEKTMASAGLGTLPMHNHVMTLGEWGFVIGSKYWDSEQLRKKSRSLTFDNTRWISNEAMLSLTSFGKSSVKKEELKVNTLNNPSVLIDYYLGGAWKLY